MRRTLLVPSRALSLLLLLSLLVSTTTAHAPVQVQQGASVQRATKAPCEVQPLASCAATTQIPRGGAFLSPLLQGVLQWFQKTFVTRPKRYRQALEQQIHWLEQQIGQVHQEKTLLEGKLSSDHAPSFLFSLRMLFSQRKSTNAWLKQELALLQEQLEDLQSGKQALEDLLQEQQDRIDSLSQRSQQESWSRRQLQTQWQLELDGLTRQLHETSSSQVARMEELLEQRIAAAQERARQQVWQEGQERIAEVESRLSKQFEQEIADVRAKTQHALEKQRYKMRALAKAMALREQKLMEQLQHQDALNQQRKKMAEAKLKQQRALEIEMMHQRVEQEQRLAEED
eukprot:Nitzschia sp. Nitz4//scaffold37_size175936//37967//38992//NITZ4_002032-RA/size175936-processed-gene-0.177-mRNA-1//1//CDS//3329549746//726//frame0